MGQQIKKVKGKVLAKHETEAIWDQSNDGAGVSYIPEQGEKVIYDPDESHPYPRTKYGDGVHIVKLLPFAVDPYAVAFGYEQNLSDEEKARARANLGMEYINEEAIPKFKPQTIQGENLVLHDTEDAKMRGLTVYGKTMQNGTPTPDNPIPLESVGDSGSIKTTITGTNLWGANTIIVGYTINNSGEMSRSISSMASDYIPVISGEEYTASEDPTYAPSTVCCCCYDESKTFISVLFEDSRTEVRTHTRSFVVPSNAKYIRLGRHLGDENIMLNSGSTALPYEPNKSQSIVHTLTEPLRGVGDIRDEIDFARGILTRRFVEIDLGTLSWTKNGSNTQFYAPLPYNTKTGYATNHLCSAYIASERGAYSSQINHTITLGNTRVWVWDSDYTSSTDFTNSIQGVKLIYELAEPIETSLTEEEIAQYKKLHTYYPTTAIFTEDGAEMAVSYVAHGAMPSNTTLADLMDNEQHRLVSDEDIARWNNKSDKPAILVQTASDNNLTLENTEEAKLRGLTIYGKTIQNGTPAQEAPIPLESVGKAMNLWSGEISAQSATTSYTFQDGTMTLLRNAGGSIQAFVWSKEKYKAGIYTLSFTLSAPAGINFRVNRCTEASATDIGTTIQTYYVSGSCSLIITLTEDSYIGFGTDSENITLTASKIMFNEGSIALPYSSYTELSEVETKITGANLCDLDSATFGACIRDGDKLISNMTNAYFATLRFTNMSQYLLSMRGKTLTFSVKNNFERNIAIVVYGTRTSGATYQEATRKNRTISMVIASDFTDITALELRWNRSTTAFTDTTTVFEEIMLNEGEELPYQPHSKQQIAVSTPNGLCGVQVSSGGNYVDENGQMWMCDEIDLERGVLVKRTHTITFVGTEDFINLGVEGDANAFFYQVDLSVKPLVIDNEGFSLCTHFEQKRITSSTTDIGHQVRKTSTGENYRIVFRPEGIATMAGATFMSWLKENPTTVTYALATPIETPLSEEDIVEYKKLHTNYPKTTITTEGIGMKVGYIVPGVLPSNTSLAQLIDDKWHRVVSDYDIARWNAIADMLEGGGLAEEATF